MLRCRHTRVGCTCFGVAYLPDSPRERTNRGKNKHSAGCVVEPLTVESVTGSDGNEFSPVGCGRTSVVSLYLPPAGIADQVGA